MTTHSPMLPDNRSDCCANGYPLKIFAFLCNHGWSRLRIPTILLPELTHDQIPCPEHYEPLIISCHAYVNFTFLFHISQSVTKLIITHLLLFERQLSNFIQSLKTSLYVSFDIIRRAYQYLILLWISCFFHLRTVCLGKREKREHNHCFYTICCYTCSCWLPIKFCFLQTTVAYVNRRPTVINFRTTVQ